MTQEQRDKKFLWATEMFKTLVFEYRIVSLDYFLHDMSLAESILCLENIKWTDFEFRTLTRYNIWSLYNSNPFGKNKNKIEDILPLPWDEALKKEHKILDDKALEEQKNLMKEMEEMLRNNNVVEENYL